MGGFNSKEASSGTYFVSNVERQVMESGLLLVKPSDRLLRFPFEAKKQISCTMQLTNKTDSYVAFMVNVSDNRKYRTVPTRGFVPPRSTVDVIANVLPRSEAPSDMQCNDQFQVQSAMVPVGISIDDITRKMFKVKAGRIVDEVMLTVVYIQPPRPPSAMREEPEKGSSSDQGNINYQDVQHPSGRSSSSTSLSNSNLESGLLSIEPSDRLLRFPCMASLSLSIPIEAKKQISCSIQLTNKTDSYVAFLVAVSDYKYGAMPSRGFVPPRSTINVIAILEAQSKAPSDMQCNDEFQVLSTVVPTGTSIDAVCKKMFKVIAGKVVDDVRLEVVYVQPPRRPSSVDEGSEEGSLPCPPWLDRGNINYQEVQHLSSGSSSSTSLSEFNLHMGSSKLKEASSRTTSDEGQVMESGLLSVQPSDRLLRFTFEAKKQISCSIQLTNKTDSYVAFMVSVSDNRKYRTSPTRGFVPPRSTVDVIANVLPRSEAPSDMECNEQFQLQSVMVPVGTSIDDITRDMFKVKAGKVVDEMMLTVVYIEPPRPPSPMRAEPEEGSSPCTLWLDRGKDTESMLHSLPVQHLKDITNNFSDERILGRGGFGVVYKGVLRNGMAIAVKKFVKAMLSSQEQFENEVNLLRKLEHKNIVRLIGFCYETQPLQKRQEGKFIFSWEVECLLCLEYLHKGSLDKYISDASSGLDWPARFKIIEGISYGLQYLHEQPDGPIIHLDLKPGNILLDQNMLPKITDFGLSRLFEQKQTIFTVISCGTLGYMAPELLRGIITPMSDIFGLGVLIMEVITGHRDYPNDSRTSSEQFIELELQRWRNVLQKEPGYTSLETDCQQIKTCIQIGLICVNPERTKRPPIQKIVGMLQGLEIMD